MQHNITTIKYTPTTLINFFRALKYRLYVPTYYYIVLYYLYHIIIWYSVVDKIILQKSIG